MRSAGREDGDRVDGNEQVARQVNVGRCRALAPVFANYIAAKLLARAQAKVVEAKVVEEVSKKAVNSLISQSDLMKASFTAATKGVSYELKKRSTQLFGEGPDEALVDQLKIEFAKNVVSLSGQVGTMPDKELVATWVAYDPEVANAPTYKQTVKSLLDEFHAVEDLGVHTVFCDDCQDQNHLLVKIGGLGYAIVNQDVETWLWAAAHTNSGASSMTTSWTRQNAGRRKWGRNRFQP